MMQHIKHLLLIVGAVLLLVTSTDITGAYFGTGEQSLYTILGTLFVLTSCLMSVIEARIKKSF